MKEASRPCVAIGSRPRPPSQLLCRHKKCDVIPGGEDVELLKAMWRHGWARGSRLGSWSNGDVTVPKRRAAETGGKEGSCTSSRPSAGRHETEPASQVSLLSLADNTECSEHKTGMNHPDKFALATPQLPPYVITSPICLY